MRFSVSRPALLSALGHAKEVARRVAGSPIYESVQLRATSSGLEIIGSDTVSSLAASLPVTLTKPGVGCVLADLFYNVVRAFPGAAVDVEQLADNGHLVLTAGRVTFRIVAQLGEHIVVPKGVTPLQPVDGTAVATVLRGVTHAMDSKEDSGRARLAFEEERDEMRAIATDGHRLAHFAAMRTGEPARALRELVIPRRAAQLAARLLEENVAAEIGGVPGEYLDVRSGPPELRIALRVRLCAESYLPWRKVIPTQACDRTVTTARQGLIDATKRMLIAAPDKHAGQMTIGSQGTLVLSAVGSELGNAREEVAASVTGEQGRAIGINLGYLREQLDALSCPDVLIETRSELDPVVIRDARDGDRRFGIIMPMRI